MPAWTKVNAFIINFCKSSLERRQPFAYLPDTIVR